MGWYELKETIDHREGATPETMEMIKRHLDLVFKHDLDPKAGPPEYQAELNHIHNGPNATITNDPDGVTLRC